MSKLGFPLLDADARSVVRRASPIERAPLEAKARVLARVEAAGASSGGQDGSASGRGPAGHVPSEPRLSGASLPLAIVVAFALGGGLGALVMHRLERAPAPIEGTHLRSTDRELPGTPAEVPSVQPATASVQRVDVQPAPNREAPATARPEPLQPA